MPKANSRRRLKQHLDKCTDPCSVCLAGMDPKCQCYYKLECGHAFHSSCLLSWYRKCNDVDLQVVIPYSDLDLQFFSMTVTVCPVLCVKQNTAKR